jgi:hypothetical protein
MYRQTLHDLDNSYVLEGLAQAGTEYTYREPNLYIIHRLVNDVETTWSK